MKHNITIKETFNPNLEAGLHLRFSCDLEAIWRTKRLSQPTAHGFLVALRCDKYPQVSRNWNKETVSSRNML